MEVVVFQTAGPRLRLASLARFAREIGKLLPPPDGKQALGIGLVGDTRMKKWNRLYRKADRTTDVLAFGGGDRAGAETELGDIAISVPQASRQARRAGHGLDRELRILILHGYLHLLGYDHETDRGEMNRLQSRLERRLLGPARRGR
jgi:rRNA maturation RNase YbeY